MKDDITPQGALFNELVNLPVHMRFDQPNSSSDGGAFLVNAMDERLGLSRRLSECLRDKRNFYVKVYCYSGGIENRIKELPGGAPPYGLSIDRTSCTKPLVNQFRGLMATAAYVLMQELRLKARHTSLHRAQVGTLRERLLKMAVWVEKSTRRIVLLARLI